MAKILIPILAALAVASTACGSDGPTGTALRPAATAMPQQLLDLREMDFPAEEYRAYIEFMIDGAESLCWSWRRDTSEEAVDFIQDGLDRNADADLIEYIGAVPQPGQAAEPADVQRAYAIMLEVCAEVP